LKETKTEKELYMHKEKEQRRKQHTNMILPVFDVGFFGNR